MSRPRQRRCTGSCLYYRGRKYPANREHPAPSHLLFGKRGQSAAGDRCFPMSSVWRHRLGLSARLRNLPAPYPTFHPVPFAVCAKGLLSAGRRFAEYPLRIMASSFRPHEQRSALLVLDKSARSRRGFPTRRGASGDWNAAMRFSVQQACSLSRCRAGRRRTGGPGRVHRGRRNGCPPRADAPLIKCGSRWTPAAAADLEYISNYLKDQHPRYRQPTMRKLYEGIRSLKESPQRGRLGGEDGTRELLCLRPTSLCTASRNRVSKFCESITPHRTGPKSSRAAPLADARGSDLT